MNIQLEHEWELFVSKQVENGSFPCETEVVQEGLRLLQEREQSRQDLLTALDKGLDALQAGEYIELDAAGLEQHLEGVKLRGRHRLQQ